MESKLVLAFQTSRGRTIAIDKELLKIISQTIQNEQNLLRYPKANRFQI